MTIDDLLERLADHLDGYHGAECHCRREIDNFPRSPSTGDDRLREAAQAMADHMDGRHENGWEVCTSRSHLPHLREALAATPAPKPENPR
jgi:hypothetical protein